MVGCFSSSCQKRGGDCTSGSERKRAFLPRCFIPSKLPRKKGERGTKSDVCLSVYGGPKISAGKEASSLMSKSKIFVFEALTKRERKQGYEWTRTKQISF